MVVWDCTNFDSPIKKNFESVLSDLAANTSGA